MFNIKKRGDILIIASNRSSKSLLFQVLSFIIKNIIILVIILFLALIYNLF